MSKPQTAPYGSWRSPITADLIVSETVGLGSPVGDGQDVCWLERRPMEGGRSVLVRRSPEGRTRDVTPAGFDVRTRVHEYGGGAFAVREGVVYFANDPDQRVYRQGTDDTARPITPPAALRYADFALDPARARLICVREDQRRSDREPENCLVSLTVAAAGDDPGRVVASGADFYASPQLKGDGSHLAWLSWDHPDMPWDSTRLWVAELDAAGAPGEPVLVAGGPGESVFEPRWGADGGLHFVSDRTGWWNLYRWRGGEAEPLHPMEAEFGLPQWLFGMSTYAVLGDGRLACAYSRRGRWELALLDPASGRFTPLETPYTSIQDVAAVPGGVLFIGGSPGEANAVVQLDPNTGAASVLRHSSRVTLDPNYISRPEAIEFPTAEGRTAHALYYRPTNTDFGGPEGERPPLLVRSHGGPTAAASTTLNLTTQYWTSRGFAVVDVNYGGSTGYGRAYRERLDGQWGIVDVDDCVHAAGHLAERGEVDRGRLAIRGSSAGGYTTLAALTFRDVFQAGASHYGISELESLATDTHKFEARYLDRMVGPYPEARAVYRARSPIHYTERLSAPVIFFQGLEDRVVPPDQAEKMVDALRHKGLPVAYVPFEGEQHGFRQAANIKRALEAELYFYSQVFDFPLPESIEPVPIENL